MAGIATLAVTAYSAYESSEAADDMTSSLNSELALSRDKWETYKNDIFPLELEAKQLGIDAQRLAVERGEQTQKLFTDFYMPMLEEGPDYERFTSQAAGDVTRSFEQQEENERIGLSRMGVDPSSGRYQAQDRSRGLQEAATRAGAITQATNYADDRYFGRIANEVGRQPPAQQSSPSPNMGNSELGRASVYGNLAGQYSANVGNTIASGIDLWDRFSGGGGGGGDMGMLSPGGGKAEFTPAPDYQYAEGGKVGLKGAGYAEGRQVFGPPGVDNVPAMIDGKAQAALTSGEYVIPKHVVEAKGTDFFDKIIERYDEGAGAGKYRGLKRG